MHTMHSYELPVPGPPGLESQIHAVATVGIPSYAYYLRLVLASLHSMDTCPYYYYSSLRVIVLYELVLCMYMDPTI